MLLKLTTTWFKANLGFVLNAAGLHLWRLTIVPLESTPSGNGLTSERPLGRGSLPRLALLPTSAGCTKTPYPLGGQGGEVSAQEVATRFFPRMHLSSNSNTQSSKAAMFAPKTTGGTSSRPPSITITSPPISPAASPAASSRLSTSLDGRAHWGKGEVAMFLWEHCSTFLPEEEGESLSKVIDDVLSFGLRTSKDVGNSSLMRPATAKDSQ